MVNDIRYLAEWECDGPIMLALPHENTDWVDILPEAIMQYKRIISAFTEHGEKILLIVPDSKRAREVLDGCPLECVTFVEIPTNDTWTRDYGPVTVCRYDRIRALDFGFNGWGLKFAACHDNMATRELVRGGTLHGCYDNRLGFVLEGGSIDSDGRGTLLTTSACLMSPNRNGDLSRAEIEDELHRTLGAERVLWLDYGALAGDDTDSHVDTLVRLAPHDTIIYTGCQDPTDEHFEQLQAMKRQLEALRTADGRPYNLVELPLPDAVYDEGGERLPATYANFLPLNGAVLMPVYGQERKDRLACDTMRVAFDGYEIVPVDCSALIRQHGSLHCATMQFPPQAIAL